MLSLFNVISKQRFSIATSMSRLFVASESKGLCDLLRKKNGRLNPENLDVDNNGFISEDNISRVCNDGEILLADLPVIYQVIQRPSKLRWIHSTWAGSDYMMKKLDGVDTKIKTDIPVTKTNTFGPQMAEYVIAYILADMRSLFLSKQHQQKSEWEKKPHLENLKSMNTSSIGILGLGSCGKEVARLCKSFGMEVWGMGRTPSNERQHDPNIDHYRVQNGESLKDMLSNCDYICSVLPSTKETRGLLSGDVLSHCKPKKPVFINVGRGDVTDEESIIKAFSNEWISGAVLDVFTEEPLPASSPLWTIPNCHITPHIAALSTPNTVAESFLSNYKRLNNGEDLDGIIDFRKEY